MKAYIVTLLRIRLICPNNSFFVLFPWHDIIYTLFNNGILKTSIYNSDALKHVLSGWKFLCLNYFPREINFSTTKYKCKRDIFIFIVLLIGLVSFLWNIWFHQHFLQCYCLNLNCKIYYYMTLTFTIIWLTEIMFTCSVCFFIIALLLFATTI